MATANAGTIAINVIARVDSLEKQLSKAREQISKLSHQAKTSGQSVNQFFSMLNKGAGAAAAVKTTEYAFRAFSNFQKALDEGKNPFVAFFKGIPVVNSLIDGYETLYQRMHGIAEVAADIAKYQDLIAKKSDLKLDISKKYNLATASGSEKEKLLALYLYTAELEKIEALEKQFEELRAKDSNLPFRDFAAEKKQLLGIYEKEIELIQKAEAAAKQKAKTEKEADKQRKIASLSQSTNTELDKLQFMSEGDSEAKAGVKAQGMSLGLSMKDMDFAIKQAEELEKKKTEIKLKEYNEDLASKKMDDRIAAGGVRGSSLEIGSRMSITGMSIGSKESLDAQLLAEQKAQTEALRKIVGNTSGGILN